MKNTNWKVPVIIGVGVLAVILMIVFGVQSSQNKAIALEEQVNAELKKICMSRLVKYQKDGIFIQQVDVMPIENQFMTSTMKSSDNL